MLNTDWSRLDKSTVAVGQFGEFYAKTVLASYGLDVYGSEVDDHGVDLIVKTKGGRYLEFQVKTVRGMQYVYMRQAGFSRERETLFLLLQILFDGELPRQYIIPASVWREPNEVFVARDGYEKPEYGVNLSKKNLPALEPYRTERMIGALRL